MSSNTLAGDKYHPCFMTEKQATVLAKMIRVNPNYDPRRYALHRQYNCTCLHCWKYLCHAEPNKTDAERMASYRFKEREIKKAKRAAKKAVKDGKQATIKSFFKSSSKK